jgi:hypothetical protein
MDVNTRIDEPLKTGACNECLHCVQVKRTLKCDQLIRNEKYVCCREIRMCGKYKRNYEVVG